MPEQYFLEQNRYEVLDKLGSGSTSKVYLVRNYEDGKKYAMKAGDKELLRQEAELYKIWIHPAFPYFKEYFEDTYGYLIMEYIEGITLQRWIEKRGKVSETVAQFIISDILHILQFLHRQSPPIIYCDVKPENIMVDKNGKLRMIDFGGAVRSRYKVGTYGYAAPEQFWEGENLTPACDIYATGKLLAFLLTGKDPCIPPYDMLQFCEKNRKITAKMCEVIQRSIAVNSLGRYENVEDFDKALRNAVRKDTGARFICHGKKEKIEYEKCVWLSEYRREN